MLGTTVFSSMSTQMAWGQNRVIFASVTVYASFYAHKLSCSHSESSVISTSCLRNVYVVHAQNAHI